MPNHTPRTDSDADNPVVSMRLRNRVRISAGVALVWLVLMSGLTARYDWSTGAAWLIAAVAVAVFATGVATMLRMRHAPMAVAALLMLTLVAIFWTGLVTGGM
ncbi:hypothetical protein [Terrabacter sp. BE26]|uniref:hypothetical protein n=1 Tax=Terrabacter sp. BE26 TaxID=2898152 RepID=UPI0035BE8BC1